MPFARRATTIIALGVVAAVGSGCATHHVASGFCGEIDHGHLAFDPDPGRATTAQTDRALAEFDRVAKHAPAAVAPDLKTVGDGLALLYRDPKKLVTDPVAFKAYATAITSVDHYLRDTCGVHIPRKGKS